MLKPKGTFAMTVWCGPDTSPCFEMLYAVIRAHGSSNVAAPQGPDFHQFAKRETALGLLSDAGFTGIDSSIVDCAWTLDVPERLFDIFEKGTVRAAMLLASQPPDNRAAIRSALTQAVREWFVDGNRWRIPVPAALLRAKS